MPAITFGNCPTRDDAQFGAPLRRAPSPYPVRDPYAEDFSGTADESPLPELYRASSPYRVMSPYAADFEGDIVVETRERKPEFFLPPTPHQEGSARNYLLLERVPTPFPDDTNGWAATDAYGRVLVACVCSEWKGGEHSFRKCLKGCFKKCMNKALVCCGLKRDPTKLATNF